MLSELRRDMVAEQVRVNGSVTVRELCTRFRTTPQTIARDLVLLASRGELRRVRGGAVRVHAGERAVTRWTAQRAVTPRDVRRQLTAALELLDARDYVRAADASAAACSHLLQLHAISQPGGLPRMVPSARPVVGVR